MDKDSCNADPNRGAIRGADRGADRGAVQSTSVKSTLVSCIPVRLSPVLPGKADGTGFGFISAGTVRGAIRGAARGAPWTAAEIVARLEDAGTALLALPMTGWSTRMRTTKLDMIRS